MIASVRGEVLDIALDHVVIEAAGVGYKVMATPSTLFAASMALICARTSARRRSNRSGEIRPKHTPIIIPPRMRMLSA